jgi:PadR family transcriptional regulator PadR
VYFFAISYNFVTYIIYVDTLYYTLYNMRNKITLNHNAKRSEGMVFNTGAALLDAIVLAVVSREDEGTYGYKITQDVRKAIDVSESTLYPVLRRLQKGEYLEVYDRQFDGRNRRYYKVTETGRTQLIMYRKEWKEYSGKINELFEGGILE